MIRLFLNPVPYEVFLNFLPLDIYSECPVALMEIVPGDTVETPIWETYRKIIINSGEKFKDFENVERFTFYERAKKAYAIVATSEPALYVNIILKKDVVVT